MPCPVRAGGNPVGGHVSCPCGSVCQGTQTPEGGLLAGESGRLFLARLEGANLAALTELPVPKSLKAWKKPERTAAAEKVLKGKSWLPAILTKG